MGECPQDPSQERGQSRLVVEQVPLAQSQQSTSSARVQPRHGAAVQARLPSQGSSKRTFDHFKVLHTAGRLHSSEPSDVWQQRFERHIHQKVLGGWAPGPSSKVPNLAS